MNAKEIYQNTLGRGGIFRDESKLSVNYVPMELPGRNREIAELTMVLNTLRENLGSMVPKILIIGPPGSGKTGVVKRLGTIIQEEFAKKRVKMRYIHINCRQAKTPHAVMTSLLRRFNPSFPPRGFNEVYLLNTMRDEVLEKKNQYLLLCLDDADHLLLNYPTFLFNLTRIEDDELNVNQRLALIVITKSPRFLENLDGSSRSTFRPIITVFEKYSSKQIYEIIRGRAKEAFFDGTVLNEALKLISGFTTVSGDARYALELLWLAGKCAERDDKFQITPDHVRMAAHRLHPTFKKEVITKLPLQEQLILLAIVTYFKSTAKGYITTGECESRYKEICKAYEVRPQSHTSFWNHIQSLIDSTDLLSKMVVELGKLENKPGRSTSIRLNMATKNLEPILLDELEQGLEKEVQSRVQIGKSGA